MHKNLKNTGKPPQKFSGESRQREGAEILLECFMEGNQVETVQMEPSKLQAVCPISGSLLNCKCKQIPARPPGSSPSPAGRPFPLGTSERPPGMEGPSCCISGLTVRRFLLKSNCHQSCCSGSLFPRILSSVERKNCSLIGLQRIKPFRDSRPVCG